jgi:hypothetical protein
VPWRWSDAPRSALDKRLQIVNRRSDLVKFHIRCESEIETPSHSIVIVRLIWLSYSRWIISSKCGIDAIPVIVSGRRLGSEQIRDDRLRVGRSSDFRANRLPT